MNLNLIGMFVEIVDSGSLSAAARKLEKTRSNISHQLKLLERETGAQLLRRSTRRLELTQAGQIMYDHGQRMMEDLSTTRASIDSLGQTLRGHVRISVPTGFGRMYVSAMLLEFARKHPGITLSVTFNNRIQDLIAAQVDVALKITLTPPLDCVARELCPIHWKLYASADYLRQHPPITCPSDLEQHSLVASPYPGHLVTLTLAHQQHPNDIQSVTLRRTLQSDDFPLLAEAVCQGMGIGLLPAYVSHAPAYRALQPLLLDHRIDNLGGHLYVLTLPNRYPSPSTRTLIDYLRESIAELSSRWT
ncbi:MAG TPA: LysR family transcriptional regulator [Candidimonas sp.]|nr:LysR family transcriptional regulator [Candidimonas sp.]